jgi:hypothetical protein
MSQGGRRERRAHGSGGAAARRTTQPGRRGPAPALGALGALALLLLAAAAAWHLAHRRSAPAGPAKETLPFAVLMDSVHAAEQAQDWARSVRWFQRVAATEPNNPMYLLALALSQHNLMWVCSADSTGRSATRTSLDRIRMQLHVLALLDSAAANARNEDEWVRVRRWSGLAYENLSLPLDALQIYTEIRMRDPGFQPTITRAEGQLKILRDPHALPATGMTRLPAAPDEILR